MIINAVSLERFISCHVMSGLSEGLLVGLMYFHCTPKFANTLRML